MSRCVPSSYVATTGSFLLKTCTAFGSAEGRCVNKCIPQVANQVGLEQDVCGENELCAPCYMPTDGAPTGACGLGCDPGPTDAPFLFDACCNGEGVCVSSSLVPPTQAAALDPDVCTGADELCAPGKFIAPNYRPPTCDSTGGLEGRCIPSCIEAVASQASLLPQANCSDGELCAPCYDPRTGASTGACDINGDQPVEAPTTYGRCCDGEGLCVPSTVVPQDQVGSLGQDTCAGADEVCAPADLADPSYIPPTCTSVGGAEGRCIETCIPAVASQAAFLPQDVCTGTKVCAPCYDPLSGAPTGACSINGDSPVADPVVFDTCCGDLGTCVPESSVPESQQGALGADTCTGTGELCAPTAYIDSTFVPMTCTSLLGAEGRCIADCVAAVQSQAQFLPQDVCATGEVCAPCYDPTSGTSTGACSVNGDAPVEEPVVFDDCCEGGGKCVPSDIVPSDQLVFLGEDTCESGSPDAGAASSDGGAATTMVCAPDFAVSGNGQPDCQSRLGPGLCFHPCTMPKIPPPYPGTCEAPYLCLPCYFNGTSLGVCDPSVPPPTFSDAGAATDGGDGGQ